MLASSVLSVVRRNLNDETNSPYRWTDAALLVYLSDVERTLRNIAPWLFLTSGETINVPVELAATTDALQLDEKYRQAEANLVCWHALSEDASDRANVDKAQQFLTKAVIELGVKYES